ncbi:MAG: hypothetical protein E6772_11610 [Dysgonomonas sp.]|nr:hypothetical protein [Dysgonomonas sp.]
MRENNEENKFSFKTVWSIIMFCVYMIIAYLVAFTPYMLPYSMHRQGATKDDDDFIIVRVILAAALFLYGIFRGYRIIKFKK